MAFWKEVKTESSDSRAWWNFRYSLVVACVSLAIGWWGVFDVIESNTATPISFLLRSDMARNPQLDPRIEMIVYDDSTINELGRPFPTSSEWALVLSHIAKQRPQSIVIDQVFQVVEHSKELDDLVALKDRLPPVVAGAFSSPSPLPGRNSARSPHRLSNLADHPMDIRMSRYMIGPAAGIQELFSGLGTINYHGSGRVPVADIAPSGEIFPNLGLSIASDVEFSDQGFLAEGLPVPVNKEGFIQVNQSEIAEYFKRAQTFSSVLRSARENRALKRIGPETHVFILPLMYTGSSDFKSTPLGEFPGGLLHVSVANSFLTGNWITHVGNPLAISFLFAIIALLISHIFTPFQAFVLIGGMALATICGGLAAFIYESVMVPWSQATLTILLTGLSGIAEKSRMLERRSLQIKHTLAGLVSPKLLRIILRAPRSTIESARRQCMTVMFIDIEGFSVKSQERDPNIVFARLKAELNQLCKIVQLYGGIVDKTLGDGLLAYFGHNLEGNHQSSNKEHAVTAICCAIDIQVNSARRIIGEMTDRVPGTEMDMMQFPLRIGINTGDVYAGNIGNDQRIDLTVVGSAVNWAKRYEDACESFRIMIGPRTAQLVSGEESPENSEVKVGDTLYSLKQRSLVVKHYEQRWSGWECNPFQHSPLQLVAALDAVSRASNQHPTKPIPADRVRLKAFGDLTLELVGFSEYSIHILSPRYLAKRESIDLEFDEDFVYRVKSKLGASKSARALTLFPSLIRATVLWGIQEGEISRHGLKIVDVSAEQRQTIIECLQEYAEVPSKSENKE